ncbi:MAG: DUF559 domain-containing protein [Planctomycetes bacterium]|nr:DUF559 domain-containing protein [Planctomycetota bacterium]
MIDDYQYLLLWDDRQSAQSLDALEDVCRRQWGPDAAAHLSDALSVLLAGRYIRSEGGHWRLTDAGLRKQRSVPRPAIRRQQKPHTQAVGPSVEGSSARESGAVNASAIEPLQPQRPTPLAPSGETFGPAAVRRNHKSAREASPRPRPPSECDVLRRLIAYYIDCVRLDERPSAVLYGNDYNRQFISISLHEAWWAERLGETIEITVPLRPAQSDFVRNLARAQQEDLFVGYPLFALPPDADRSGLIVPMCCIPATAEQEDTTLRVTLDFDEADVNGDWLQKQFRTGEERRAFLRACGLIDPEEDSGEETPADFLRLPDAISGITTFCGRALVDQPLDPQWTRPIGDFAAIAKGVHNAAVLYLGRRLVYNAGLVSELRRILASASDEDLKKTALWHIFGTGSNGPQTTAPLTEQPPSSREAAVVPFLPVNYEQEQAVRTSLQSGLTVITGPPGTGKSQVAANLLANLAVSGQSAIFASRNHKALDAVVPRLNEIVPNETILFRTKNPDTGEEFTWRNAINQILAAPVDAGAEVDHTYASAEIHDWLGRRNSLLEVAETWTVLERELGQAQRTWDDKTSSLPSAVVDLVRLGEHLPAGDVLREMESGLGVYPAAERSRWGLWLLRLWWRLRHWPAVRSRLPAIEQSAAAFGMALPPPEPTPPFVESLRAVVSTLCGHAALHELHSRITQLQTQAGSLRPLTDVLQEMELVLERLRERAPGLLHACLRRRFSHLAPQERQRLLQMRNTLDHTRDTAIGEGTRIRWQRLFQDQFDLLIRCFPLWAVPSLSARHGLPLAPAIADAAVLDEASQCDVASAIPLLYRTKRAVIIGDPNQLRPVHNMKPGRNRQLLRKHGLLTPSLAQFDFLQSSLYDLAAATPKAGEPVLLRDHFRCHPDIAAYCNSLVYKGQLRVLTDESRLRRPKGRKAGIAWTEVTGAAEAVTAGGAICQEEIGAVGRELNRLLVEDRFSGTVGVVTPFREQANRIRDWAESNIPADLLRKADFIAATADGFQGDQRDVILCSPVYQPGLPRGAEWYVTSKDTRNLWNVAISRAQALLHVFGNRQMCLQSDVNHLVLLAKLSLTPPSYDPGKPVFESMWERRLYDALVAVGLAPFTQYPLAGCRLDLAFRDARLDVEVDGERFHRDAQGRRKAEDLWRDLAIRGAGWTVMRFWVYELREDMAGCVRKIQDRLTSLSERVTPCREEDGTVTDA